MLGGRLGPEVGHSRRHDDDIGRPGRLLHGPFHIGRRLDVDARTTDATSAGNGKGDEVTNVTARAAARRGGRPTRGPACPMIGC